MLPPTGFREITRTVTVSYPVPFAFATCLAFAIFCLCGSLYAQDLLRWVFVGFAVTVTVAGLALFISAMLWRPELLRSEHHALAQRVLQIAEDSDVSSPVLETLSRHLLADQQPERKGGTSAARETIKDDDNGG